MYYATINTTLTLYIEIECIAAESIVRRYIIYLIHIAAEKVLCHYKCIGHELYI